MSVISSLNHMRSYSDTGPVLIGLKLDNLLQCDKSVVSLTQNTISCVQ